MLTIVLGATTVICAVGWLVRWVACAALAKYMIDKGYTPRLTKNRRRVRSMCGRRLLKSNEGRRRKRVRKSETVNR